ncbi:MAG: hypothetical protein PHU53_07935, partial [Thermoplasmata archaeon]|nr:hypothetical protein [Thermoplasmata archaeon]
MIVAPGAVDVVTYFVLVDPATGVPETGLTITDLDATYTRDGAAASKADLTACAAVDAAHSDNTAIQVDATNAPGLYRVDWPDAAFATGVARVQLCVNGAAISPAHLEVELVPWLTPITGATVRAVNSADAGLAVASTALTNVTWTDARAGYIDKAQYLPAVTAGNAGGVFIAGANAATSVTTALTANITGNLTGSVGSVAANGIGATSIAADAINATSIKTDAVTKIQSGLATPTNITAGTITTVSGNVTGTVAGIAGTLTTIDALWAKIQKWLRLALRKDAATATDCATELTEINANGGSGAGAYTNTTDAQEAIRDTEPLGTAMRGTDSAVLATTVGAAGAGLTAIPTIANVTTVGSVTGAVGSVTGSVGSVTAGVTLANGAHGGALASMNMTGGIVGSITGNLSGSVGSVTGSVGSVTGAVGSVTNPVTAGTVSDKTGYALS